LSLQHRSSCGGVVRGGLVAFTTTASGQKQDTGTEKYKDVFFHKKMFFVVFFYKYTQLLSGRPGTSG
jgi:hypothetical protein